MVRKTVQLIPHSPSSSSAVGSVSKKEPSNISYWNPFSTRDWRRRAGISGEGRAVVSGVLSRFRFLVAGLVARGDAGVADPDLGVGDTERVAESPNNRN